MGSENLLKEAAFHWDLSDEHSGRGVGSLGQGTAKRRSDNERTGFDRNGSGRGEPEWRGRQKLDIDQLEVM